MVKQYTLDEVKHLHGEALSAVALDKRQPDEIRLAAIHKRPDSNTLAQIAMDGDNEIDVREAARDILRLEYEIDIAFAGENRGNID